MSGRGKRLWAPRLDFNAAFQETQNFLQRAESHNLVRPQPATLYHAYLVEGTFPTEGMDELSTYLRFGQKDSPQIDRGRLALVRLLAVALKAHFFLAEEAIVLNEPYVFVLPDLAAGGQLRYGLVYPIEVNGRTQSILVADEDLAMVASRRLKLPSAQRFPAVLPDASHRWLNLSQWRSLRDQAIKQFGSTKSFARKTFGNQAREHADLATFTFGTVLDYDRELNPDVMAVGGMWAAGIRKWYLPLGFDVDAARDYLNLQHQRTPAERYDLRWYDLAKPPKD